MSKIVEHREFGFEVRAESLVEEMGEFDAYGAIFGEEDSFGTTFIPGAFRRTIRTRKKWPLFYWHGKKSDKIAVGLMTAQEDEKGLLIRGKLDMAVEFARNLFSGIKNGYLSRFSIGFKRKRDRRKNGTIEIVEAQLFEGSIMPLWFQSAPGAEMIATRALNELAQRDPGDVLIEELMQETRSLHALFGNEDPRQGQETSDALTAMRELAAAVKKGRP